MSTEIPQEMPKCLICTDTASGIHFGVMVCRACAAFYRRSTISNRRYVCRFNGNCEIGKDVRCCCRACRFSRCEAMGMKADAVQRHRDRIGPRKQTAAERSEAEAPDQYMPSAGSIAQPNSLESAGSSTSSTNSAGLHPTDEFRPSVSSSLQFEQDGRSFAQLTAWSPTTLFPASPTVNSAWTSRLSSESFNQLDQTAAELPLISEMIRGYRKAVALQRTATNLNETTNFNRLFDDRASPVEGNYHDNNSAILAGVPIVSEMINSHFQPLEQFETSVKWTLLRQFFCQFVIAERSYRTAKRFPNLDDPRTMITPDHFTSLSNLDFFFSVKECKVEPIRMAEIFKPTFTRINAMITNPMRKLNLCEPEFVGLLGLLFWNDTLSNLEPNETKMVVETQRAIVNELYSITKLRAGPNPLDVSVRFGIICNLVPLASRFANEIAANFSLVNVSNAFAVDDYLHGLVPHAF